MTRRFVHKTKDAKAFSHGTDNIIGRLSMHEYDMKNLTFKFEVTRITFTPMVTINVYIYL